MIWEALKKWVDRPAPAKPDNINRDMIFAVPDTEPWWLAVMSVIDEAEWETVLGSRRYTANTNQCIAAIGAGEGCDLIRQKLHDKRNLALRARIRHEQTEVYAS